MKWLIPILHRQQLRQAAQYFAQQGVELLDLNGPEQLRNASGLLVWGSLASPLGYLATADIWKTWLQQHAPSVKLFVLSLTEACGAAPNVLDLLDLPPSLAERFEQALDSNADWQPPPTIGLNLQHRLDTFMVGHGDESLPQALGKLGKHLSWLNAEMQTPNLQEYADAIRRLTTKLAGPQQILDAWALLCDRWLRMADYTPYFPFATDLQAVAKAIAVLTPYFDSGLRDGAYYLEQDCYERYHELDRTINTINNRYAREKTPHTAS